MAELQTGMVVDGRYKILDTVGNGGIGIVYRARDVREDSIVALKLLNISGELAQRRFLREFDILSRVRHPRIVVSRRWGLHDGRPYFSMDYVDGRPLSDLISNVEYREKLKSAWLVPFVRQTGEGLAYIHELGVIHKDLKPSNIIISECDGQPEVTILDLGLARFKDAAGERLTPPEAATGTLEYMSPEQIRGRGVDQRSDLYSLGVILYEILSGNPPFTGTDPATVLIKHLRELPCPPHLVADEISSGIEESVMKLLKKEPIDRYSSVGSLLYDLTINEASGFHEYCDEATVTMLPVLGTTDVPFLQPQFQGRQQEMKALWKILQDTREGVGHMILVSGSAGIGKTQVLEEFKAYARVNGMRVQTGRCYESGGQAFGPFLEMLRDMAELPDIRGSDLEASVRRVLTQIERPAPADQPDPYPAMETLSELLVDLSREAPTLVCIEDLQWADDLTLRFLDFMRRNPDPAPFIFGLACRKVDEDPLPPGIDDLTNGPDGTRVVHFHLQPLSMDETGCLAASLLGEQAVSEEEARRVFLETGGNPLFIVEMVRGAIADGSIWKDSAGNWNWPKSTEWPMPTGIMQAIELRLGRLQSSQRQVLEYASIFRGAFSFELISEVWCKDELDLLEKLDTNVNLGHLDDLQEPSGRYRFSHGLIRRAVYDGISESQRTFLHQEAGRALEKRLDCGATESLDELAYHFSRSNDLEKMALYVTESGRKALGMQYFSYALKQFRTVLKKGAFSPDAPVGIARGSVMHLDFLCAYSEALCGCDRYEDARREMEGALQWASVEMPAQRANALRILGITYLKSGDYQRAESMLLEALELLENQGEDENELRVLGLLSNLYVVLNKKEVVARYSHLAAAKCREMGGSINEARALIHLGFAAQFTYLNDRSKKLLDSSLNLLENNGDRTHRHNCLFLLGRAENRLGNFDRAEEIFLELKNSWAKRGSRIAEAGSLVYLGRIVLERGDTEAAEAHASAAVRLLSGAESPDEMCRAHALLAETLAQTGRVEEALAWAERAWRGVKYGGNVRAIAWTAKAKSLVAADRHEEVDSLFEYASDAQGSPDGFEQVNLLVVAGSYYVERRRHADARRHLENARQAAERLNLRYLARKAADLLNLVIEETAMTITPEAKVAALSQEHLQTLYEVSEDLTSLLDLNVLLDRILDRLKKVSHAERVLIAIEDGAAGRVKVARKYNLDDLAAREISQGIIRWSMRQCEPVLSLDARVDDRFRKRASVSAYGIRSVLCVPLRHAESGVIGALYLDHRKLEDLFREEDTALIAAFAHLASIAVVNARMFSRIQEQALFFQEKYEGTYRMGELIGQSQVMQEVFKLVDVAAESDMTVLIQGETGTGKELAARAIHTRSNRKAKPFLSANCGALTHELLQSELFGHKRGSFTGASSDRKGLFASAEGGSVFLDEIGDASSQLQISLLRVLQDGETQRVGETNVRHVDVRVIAATNRDLEADVRAGLFREDLYYRLRVLQIEMPPLRDRIEDIPSLSEHILKRVSSEQGKEVLGFTVGAMRGLMDHAWPGNVRELQNEIRRAVALVEEGKKVSVDLFSKRIEHRQDAEQGSRGHLKSEVAALEKRMIAAALDKCKGNISHTAAHLGLSRNGLQKMMTRYGLR